MYVSSVTAFLVTYSSSTHLHLDKVELSLTLSIKRHSKEPQLNVGTAGERFLCGDVVEVTK